ncbi:telomere-protecting terminal protein Tpg [Streptomyces lydicus]|uniref:telomere-protecting terminal protein Tpg n=1 Tax=Streptomyces lydicus TaxID=47763 RepID=UPI001010E6BB|nr:hypothetical protein [Streptomyces lydicus]MCZ1011871.1 hypothetical protein [Streptomyces lydicus]
MAGALEARVIDALDDLRDQVHRDLQRSARRTLPARLHTPNSQVAYLHRRLGRSTGKTAELLGVHPETIRRYLRGQRKNPPPAFAASLAAEIRRLYQPRITGAQIDARINQHGLYTKVRAQFGFYGLNGTKSDDPRERWLNEKLTPATTAALLQARAAADESTARDLLSRGIAEAYFRFEHSGMDAEMTYVAFVKFEF